MFSRATLDAAHRLVTFLMTLADAVSGVVAFGGTRTFSELAARALQVRLVRLLAALARVLDERPRPRTRIRTRPTSTTPRAPAAPTPPNPLRTENWRLRTEPGWLLKALPDAAPAIAADLDALLADPAFTALLDADPALRRTLNPLLRALALPLPACPASPPPRPPTFDPSPPDPDPPVPPEHSPLFHAQSAAPPRASARLERYVNTT